MARALYLAESTISRAGAKPEAPFLWENCLMEWMSGVSLVRQLRYFRR